MIDILIAIIFVLLAIGGLMTPFITKKYIGPIVTIMNFVSLLVALAMGYILFSNVESPTTLFVLYIDHLGTLFTILILILSTIASYYSIPMLKDENARVQRYYFWFSFFVFAMIGIVMAGDILSTYLFLEGATIFSVFLVAHFENAEAFEASLKYLIICSFGTAIILVALAYIAVLEIGSFNYAIIYSYLTTHQEGIVGTFAMKIVFLAIFFGFGAKAGVFPFHTWLPDTYAEAPAPISAVISGIMTETAAVALIRTFDAFSPVITADMNLMVATIGAITMVLGALLALVQDDLKRLIAYSSMDEIGYIILGIGIATSAGVYGSVFHVLNHSFLKSLLFLISGILLYTTGTRNIKQMGGLAKKMPVVAVAFAIAGLSLGSVPPFNGFYSKYLIYEAAFTSGQVWFAVIAIITSVIALAYFIRATHHVFLGEPKMMLNGGELKKIPREMMISILVLLALIFTVTIAPQWFLEIVTTAVSNLMSF